MRTIRMLALVALLLGGPSATAEDLLVPDTAVRAELVPTGRLRVALLVGNPITEEAA